MTEQTVVIGHKNPDTDSICSAICYSELKMQIEKKEITAGRAGTINPQTDFVLNYFKRPAPRFFSHIYPRLFDIMSGKPISVDSHEPVLTAMNIFKDEGIRFLPVTDKRNIVVGTISPGDLTKQFISYVDPERARSVVTSPYHIKVAAKAEALTEAHSLPQQRYTLLTGAMSGDSFQKTVNRYNPLHLIIIVGDRNDILARSIESGVGVVLLSGSPDIESSVTDKARMKGVCLLRTSYDSQTAAWLVKMSTPSGYFSTKEFFHLRPDNRVESARNELIKSARRGIVVTDNKHCLQGVVTKSDLLKKSSLSLILVDHNELPQAVDGAYEANIIEIIDHHRLSAFQTASPIYIKIEPVGSTCTLVAEMYIKRNIDISMTTAGLLLSGIISDTVTGRSPTTTSRDMEAMNILEAIAKVKIKSFSDEMFNASSIVGERPSREVLLNDFKEFFISGRKIGIGQVEVVGFNRFFQVKKEIHDAIREHRREKGFDMVGLMVTDITYETTLLPVDADSDIIDALGFPVREKNIFELKGVLSRKKQVIPHLFNIFK